MSENKIPVGSSQVKTLSITEHSEGQRLDNFLKKHLKGVPLSHLYRIVRTGQVRVNKGRVKVSYKLQLNDRVRIPPVRISLTDKTPLLSDGLFQRLKDSVLFEDSNLLVINKPSGLAVHGGSGINLGLIEAVRQMYPEGRNFELVHRLDRETSGCILVAKKRSLLKELQSQFRSRSIKKSYQALVVGKWPQKQRQVDAPLRKNSLVSQERIVIVDKTAGKPALTHFEVLKYYTRATLLEVKPVTGRTHQIRVHTRYAGHPILGDEKYALDWVAKDKTVPKANRLFLHAVRLKFEYPEGKKFSVEAPLPPAWDLMFQRCDS